MEKKIDDLKKEIYLKQKNILHNSINKNIAYNQLFENKINAFIDRKLNEFNLLFKKENQDIDVALINYLKNDKEELKVEVKKERSYTYENAIKHWMDESSNYYDPFYNDDPWVYKNNIFDKWNNDIKQTTEIIEYEIFNFKKLILNIDDKLLNKYFNKNQIVDFKIAAFLYLEKIPFYEKDFDKYLLKEYVNQQYFNNFVEDCSKKFLKLFLFQDDKKKVYNEKLNNRLINENNEDLFLYHFLHFIKNKHYIDINSQEKYLKNIVKNLLKNNKYKELIHNFIDKSTWAFIDDNNYYINNENEILLHPKFKNIPIKEIIVFIDNMIYKSLYQNFEYKELISEKEYVNLSLSNTKDLNISLKQNIAKEYCNWLSQILDNRKILNATKDDIKNILLSIEEKYNLDKIISVSVKEKEINNKKNKI